MIHHVSLEVEKGETAVHEWRFWGILGFYPTRPPSSSATNRQHWLVHRDGTAIHLYVTPQPDIPKAGHVALIEEDFHRTLKRLDTFGHSEIIVSDRMLGAERAWVKSPSGHLVELYSAKVNAKAGPPADTEEGCHDQDNED